MGSKFTGNIHANTLVVGAAGTCHGISLAIDQLVFNLAGMLTIQILLLTHSDVGCCIGINLSSCEQKLELSHTAVFTLDLAPFPTLFLGLICGLNPFVFAL